MPSKYNFKSTWHRQGNLNFDMEGHSKPHKGTYEPLGFPSEMDWSPFELTRHDGHLFWSAHKFENSDVPNTFRHSVIHNVRYAHRLDDTYSPNANTTLTLKSFQGTTYQSCTKQTSPQNLHSRPSRKPKSQTRIPKSLTRLIQHPLKEVYREN